MLNITIIMALLQVAMLMLLPVLYADNQTTVLLIRHVATETIRGIRRRRITGTARISCCTTLALILRAFALET
jgi:hypothetical protein